MTEYLTPFASTRKNEPFCKANCANKACFRYFSKADRERVKNGNFQIALVDYSNGCTAYQEGSDD